MYGVGATSVPLGNKTHRFPFISASFLICCLSLGLIIPMLIWNHLEIIEFYVGNAMFYFCIGYLKVQYCIVHQLNPIDPNPAISAHVVFPQSGHIRPEKRPFFRNFPHFSKIEPYKNYEPLIGVQYIILKPMESCI